MPNTAKQEAIRKAYEAIGQKPHYKHTDDNGWTAMFDEDSYKVTPSFKELGFTQQQVSELLDSGLNSYTGTLEWRPKSLQGIENNNGWIRIESEEDLPPLEDDSEFWIANKNGIFGFTAYSLQVQRKWENKTLTHYQKVVKPEKPIY